MKKQVALIILDGWGYRTDTTHNAVAQAHTPVFDRLWQAYPHTLLQASEEYVGLPKGQVGNSEIGHTTIGAGQIIDTDLVRISKSIVDGSFSHIESFRDTCTYATTHHSTIHVMGLLGGGGVHSHQTHLHALIVALKQQTQQPIALHLFTDGRDAGPYDSLHALRDLEQFLDHQVFIATIAGRYYAMDRDNNWDRLQKFLDLITDTVSHGQSDVSTERHEYISEIQQQHAAGHTDEHITPFLVRTSLLQKHDAVIVFNFRADRVRMLVTKLLSIKAEQQLHIATLTEYKSDFDVSVAFPPKKIETVLAKELSHAGLTQAHIAETEKFPHATYFLNGGTEAPHDGEEHVLLESRKDVVTHDQAPEMRATAIADAAIQRIEQGVDFIFINFANPDMVGHTANVPAIITALECVDRELGRVVATVEAKGGIALITADHGNAEVNIDPITGDKHTAHTTNPVPCILTDREKALRGGGSLQDIAPTILHMYGLRKPSSMTGTSLLTD